MEAGKKDGASKPEVVVVTGASAGVGRAIVQAFAREGASIGLIARDEERLETTREEVEKLGGRAIVLPADVADAEAIEKAAERVEQELGPIDIWVNSAMTSIFAPFTAVTPEEFRRVTDVTYHGFVYGTMSALKRMLPRDRGVIVQVGSALAYRGIPLQSAYCGAKHAIQGMFDSIRTELLAEGSKVHMTMVQLPAINTPQFDWVRSKMPRKAQPVPPIFQPEVAADAVVFAARSKRREIYLGLAASQVIIGNKIAPAIGDHYLARTGFEDQQREEPEVEGRPDNLFSPVKGPYGARGSFDKEASTSSPQLWFVKNKRWLTAAGAVAGLVGAALLRKR
jgi:NAD(P)-dependent dehydrogenase (short-subunit alcohol dehydrogenase family)